MKKTTRQLFTTLLLLLLLPLSTGLVVWYKSYVGKAAGKPAHIYVETNSVVGPLANTWQSLAQGGEEKGTPMLSSVVKQVSMLSPRYIRIDHIYDFYNVVQTNNNNTTLYWDELDKTVCDILRTGATPFFSLGYMPEALSIDGGLISKPKDWNQWSYLVQKTIERYSGTSSRICGRLLDNNLEDVYYEVWNEPDLEAFGSWSIHGGEKDYKELYYYSAKGAEEAQDTKRFFLGGPATTAPYQNWFRIFLSYVDAYNLRLDFLSWHRYSSDPEIFGTDMSNIDYWLQSDEYASYSSLPRVISEWGYDSNPNPLYDTNLIAAHTISVIRELADQNLKHAFTFEIKDGKAPRWGILSYTGEKKPRFHALELLGILGNKRLLVNGETEYVRALASRKLGSISAVIVNYDDQNAHREVVPITFTDLEPDTSYRISEQTLGGRKNEFTMKTDEYGVLTKLYDMQPNSIVAIELHF